MGLLNDKIAVVTGGGGGSGRAAALALASAGATVVVNDPGVAPLPGGDRPAAAVVAEIVAAGGKAVANFEDASDWAGGERLIEQAFALDGHLDVLVCTADAVRDRTLHRMSIDEWDAVVHVQLRGHFIPTRLAAARWREQSMRDGPVDARVIYTASDAGLFGHACQANYAAATAGITGLCFTAAQELELVGVTVNTVSPRGGTSPASARSAATDPAGVGPMVVLLARDEATDITGQVFRVHGGTVTRLAGWTERGTVNADHGWEPDELLDAVGEILPGLRAPAPAFRVAIG